MQEWKSLHFFSLIIKNSGMSVCVIFPLLLWALRFATELLAIQESTLQLQWLKIITKSLILWRMGLITKLQMRHFLQFFKGVEHKLFQILCVICLVYFVICAQGNGGFEKGLFLNDFLMDFLYLYWTVTELKKIKKVSFINF